MGIDICGREDDFPAIETKLCPPNVNLGDIRKDRHVQNIELHINLTKIAKSKNGGTALMRGAIEEFKNECLAIVKEMRKFGIDAPPETADGNISGGN